MADGPGPRQKASGASPEAGGASEEGVYAGLTLRGIGPALMSGRVGDIAVDPVKHSTWYVAAASGGVWKTTNSGTTWAPIFDGYGSYSIGCVAVDPGNHLVVWVGTGESGSQRSVGYGDGLYKSIDGGASFSKVGLERSEHIAKVLIDPRDSNVVYVAVQGPLWNPGGDRGCTGPRMGARRGRPYWLSARTRVSPTSPSIRATQTCSMPRPISGVAMSGR